MSTHSTRAHKTSSPLSSSAKAVRNEPQCDCASMSTSSSDDDHVAELMNKNISSLSPNNSNNRSAIIMEPSSSSSLSFFHQFKMYLHRRIMSETRTVRAFQEFFGVVQVNTNTTTTNMTTNTSLPSSNESQQVGSKPTFKYSKFWYYLFLWSSELGNEGMFASFLPFIFWHIDQHLGIRIMIAWALSFGIGQYLKDLFELPRPQLDSRLESCYENEFGFPSTHASGSTVLAISFFGYFLKYYSFENAPYLKYVFIIAMVAWIVLCCMSRLYLGVHSLTDIYGGLLIGSFVLFICHKYVYVYLEPFFLMDLNMSSDNTTNLGDLITSRSAFITPLFIVAFTVGIMTFYSTSLRKGNPWRSSYGDTGRVFGAFCGALLGIWCVIVLKKPQYVCERILHGINHSIQDNNEMGFLQMLFSTPPSLMPYVSSPTQHVLYPQVRLLELHIQDWAKIAWTSVVGIVWLLMNKEITKVVVFRLLKTFYLPERETKNMKELMHSRYDVEIPVILTAYTMIGFTATCLNTLFVIGVQ
ncbi:hypothetical protein C9374_009159 [Naegleria lovaniensis]|uniref:Phosphatidic acid phosphatase type 2/haloperoxidase domain-containing protein n=1 Tax=Naegleria lovaniensis TaxID=51637 RepID=A0AA88GFM3_NAELO|nr:uncharacterized protein C9374_009159 [Naegleria lovaniensis]KAG2377643.1 hypothetical protein C9374_009159 [Naegleria lovaniensis]